MVSGQLALEPGLCPTALGGRKAFTLIESVVAIALIGVISSLLLVGIHRSRHAVARLQCANNLRQVGLALHNHHGFFNRFPSGGWGWEWIGVPGRGSGAQQPGGWIFSILPFVEQQNLVNIANCAGPDFEDAMAKMLATPVPVFNCPARRTGGPYPNSFKGGRFYQVVDSGGELHTFKPAVVARSDYAGNAGSQKLHQWGPGPASLEEGDDSSYAWPDPAHFRGIFFPRSQIRLADITRGTSNVFLAGERYADSRHYTTGLSQADNECLYVGFDNDVIRTTYYPPREDAPKEFLGLFGSSHFDGLNMLYADGSVHLIGYNIDPIVFRVSGQRE